MSRLFTSTSDIITQGTAAVPTTGSLVVRLYPTWASNDSADHGIIDLKNAGATDGVMIQKYSDNNLYMGWYHSSDFTNASRVIASTYTLNQNAWNSFAITWTSGSTLTAYLNGSVLGTKSSITTSDTSGGTRSIGNYAATGGDCRGRLADYAIFNVVLTAAEVLAYHKGVSPLDLRAGTSPTDYLPLVGLSPEPNLGSNG